MLVLLLCAGSCAAAQRDCGHRSDTGVALKVMRMFKCRMIEGQYWLEADMRLECYTGEWAGCVQTRYCC